MEVICSISVWLRGARDELEAQQVAKERDRTIQARDGEAGVVEAVHLKIGHP